MKLTDIFSKEKHSDIDTKHYIYTICSAQLLPLQLQENSKIQLVWNKMSQTPPILSLLLSPFLDFWAILLLFVQQLIYSLRVIFGRRKRLQRNTSKPDKWTHKTAFRGFRWLRWVALLSSFYILGRKIGKTKMKHGKGCIHKVLLLLLVLYTPSLPHQAQCSEYPSGYFCKAGRSICPGCIHADRQHSSHWLSVTTYTWSITRDTCLLGPHRAELTPKHNMSLWGRGFASLDYPS